MFAPPDLIFRKIVALSIAPVVNPLNGESIIADKVIQRNRFKIMMAYMIGIVPCSLIRCLLYRILFGYRIHKSRIGWNTTICVAEATLYRCTINRHNSFIGPMRVTIGKDTKIDSGNLFNCGWWVLEEQYKSSNYGRLLNIGEDTRIGPKHSFDVVGSLTIGDRTTVAGQGSQFWTHGAGVKDRNIAIGDDCYIGSGVLFSPGSSIHNKTIVALGSVVAGAFPEDNLLIGGVPARRLKTNYNWRLQ